MKKSFLTGLILLLPIAVTFFLFSLILDIFTSPFLTLVSEYLSKYQDLFPLFSSPVFVVFFAKVIIILLFSSFILLLGFLGRWFLFRTLLYWGNILLLKIPFFKSIYHTAKDLINSVFSIDERKAFVKPIMIQFPSEKSSCIGFLSGSVPPECEKAINKKLTSVFVPTAPHPISGYLVFATDEGLNEIKMTNEEAVKFTVSCGVIVPEDENIK